MPPAIEQPAAPEIHHATADSLAPRCTSRSEGHAVCVFAESQYEPGHVAAAHLGARVL
jgi:hypothetical protein